MEAALYIKCIYRKMLADYFPDASFFKPVGDGLMIIQHVKQGKEDEPMNKLVASGLELVRGFKSICEEDTSIDFRVPHSLGIGMAVGNASRLFAGRTTLDYSGKTLNLAARLMDLARPEGVVFHGRLNMLSTKLQGQFESEMVYIRGIAPTEPVRVFYTNKYTEIPTSSLRPLEGEEWKTVEKTIKLADLKNEHGRFRIPLPTPVYKRRKIIVKLMHPKATPSGGRHRERTVTQSISNYKYELEGGKPLVRVWIEEIVSRLETERVGEKWPVTISVSYAQR
jgi:hypothetical protein